MPKPAVPAPVEGSVNQWRCGAPARCPALLRPPRARAGPAMQRAGSGSRSVSAHSREMPAPETWSGASVLRPHTTTVGAPVARAPASTANGALPRRLCSSSEPSPVTTRSAPGRASANPTSSSTVAAPDRDLARRGAPSRRSRRPRRARARGVAQVASGGGGHQVGPPGQSRLEKLDVGRGRALLRAVDLGRPRRARAAGCRRRRPASLRRHRAGRAATRGRGLRPRGDPHRRAGTGRPRMSRIRAPRAATSPAPPSVEALPPRPTTTSRQPASTRRQHRLAGAASGRGQGREPRAEPAQAGRVGQLDDRDVTATGVRRRHRLAARPGHRDGYRSNPADTKASRVPSPPSATGTRTTSTSGATPTQPAAQRRPRPRRRSATP